MAVEARCHSSLCSKGEPRENGVVAGRIQCQARRHSRDREQEREQVSGPHVPCLPCWRPPVQQPIDASICSVDSETISSLESRSIAVMPPNQLVPMNSGTYTAREMDIFRGKSIT